jgi:hypothetical protein
VGLARAPTQGFVDVLRESWRPLGYAATWTTRLLRDLEAVEEAEGDARVFVLTYPNPDPALAQHRDRMAGFVTRHSMDAAGYRTMGEDLVQRLAP